MKYQNENYLNAFSLQLNLDNRPNCLFICMMSSPSKEMKLDYISVRKTAFS